MGSDWMDDMGCSLGDQDQGEALMGDEGWKEALDSSAVVLDSYLEVHVEGRMDIACGKVRVVELVTDVHGNPVGQETVLNLGCGRFW